MSALRRACRAATLVAALLVVVLGARPSSAAKLFALVDTGELFSSVNGGVTWTILATLPVDDAVAIAAAETPSELFLMTQSGSVYRSTNAGVSWTGVGVIAASDIVGMAIELDGDILALSRSGALWRSTNNGATFTGISVTSFGDNFRGIVEDPASGRIFTVAETGEVGKSVNAGVSFSPAGVITTDDASALLMRSGNLYALTRTGAVARSNNDGATWTFVGTFSQVNAAALTTDGTKIIAVTSEGDVASSNDAVSWTFVGEVNQLNVVALGNDIPTVTSVGPSRTPAAGLRISTLYPNPRGRGEAITVEFVLNEAAGVSLELYSVDGRLVASRAATAMGSGPQRIEWTPPRRAAGVYFLRARTTSGLTANARLVLVD